jgi:hypothetical protein
MVVPIGTFCATVSRPVMLVLQPQREGRKKGPTGSCEPPIGHMRWHQLRQQEQEVLCSPPKFM